jgi:hypothetical protein
MKVGFKNNVAQSYFDESNWYYIDGKYISSNLWGVYNSIPLI